MKGIYCYIDKKTDEIVYIGKDSHIDEDRRHKDHMGHSRYNAQKINQILQSNPDRYKYEILRTGDFSNNWLSALEILYIRRYQPKFNFTIGGEGTTGYKHTNEAKIKMSKSHKGKTVSKETKRKISDAMKGENNPMYGKTLSDEHKQKLSEAHTKKYARIIKDGSTNGKQGYAIIKDGKMIKHSIYIHKLYKWFGKEFPEEFLYLEVN